MQQEKTEEELEKWQIRDIKKGLAEMLPCAHCGKKTYFGAMNLISLAIQQNKPACSYDCNKALGQTSLGQT